jgi:hypothetical protein
MAGELMSSYPTEADIKWAAFQDRVAAEQVAARMPLTCNSIQEDIEWVQFQTEVALEQARREKRGF